MGIPFILSVLFAAIVDDWIQRRFAGQAVLDAAGVRQNAPGPVYDFQRPRNNVFGARDLLLGHGNVVLHRFKKSIVAVLLERSQRRLFRPDLSDWHTRFL